MRKNKALWIVVVLAAVGAPSAEAQDAELATPSRSKEAAIREVLQLTGAAALGMQVMEQMRPALEKAIPNVPASFWNEFMAEVRPDELVDIIVPVYSKHFTLDELEQLVQFYKTPVGRRVIDEMPAVMKESMAAGQEWGRQIGARAYRKAEEARHSEKP